MGYDLIEYAETPLGALAFHQTGSGEPLLLHHGGESHKGQYSVFAPLLADGIRAISYDQRDIADSFGVADPYDVGAVADDCVALMDALGIEKAHIMGISFGGVVTLHVGLRHPDRVQTLMVGAAPADFKSASPYAAEMLSKTVEERTEMMVAAVLSDKGLRNADMAEQVRQVVSGGYTQPGSHRMAAVRTHDVADVLHQITAPTLFFYGADDPLVSPETGTFMADRVAGSELVVIPEARHGLSFEFKEETAKLVSDFVLSHPLG